MTFTPTGVLRVDVPPGTRRAEIEATVRAHARWIAYRLGRAERDQGYRSPGLTSGEVHHYLGVLYRLDLVPGVGRTCVQLVGGALRVSGDGLDEPQLITALRAWYRDRAGELFAARLQALVPRLRWLDRVPMWRQRYMTAQWGSCSAAGRLSLNTHLAKVPRSLVDYVLLHELCHLRHLNHGPAFYALLGRHMPDWEVHRAALHRYTPMLRDRF